MELSVGDDEDELLEISPSGCLESQNFLSLKKVADVNYRAK